MFRPDLMLVKWGRGREQWSDGVAAARVPAAKLQIKTAWRLLKNVRLLALIQQSGQPAL
jgi:hypothetical protein